MIFILALHISTIPNISYIIFKKFWVIIEWIFHVVNLFHIILNIEL